jgi:hypothetical protein
MQIFNKYINIREIISFAIIKDYVKMIIIREKLFLGNY